MLDFRKRTRTTQGTRSPQHTRLVSLVMLSAIILMLMLQAARPSVWRWMFAEVPDRGNNTTAVESPDTRLAAGQAGGPGVPDAFVSPSDVSEPAAEGAARRYFPGVNPKYLDAVRDDTVFRAAESDAWYHLLALLAKTSEEELAKASTGNVGFVQLFKQPKAYRGQVVTVRGTVRRVEPISADKNDYGVRSYYRIWLEPAGGPVSPIVIFVLELPAKFPIGMDVNADVTASGFFFKRWAYPAKDTIRTAPLLLSRTVDWTPSPPAQPAKQANPREAVPYILGVIFLAMLAVGAIYMRSRRGAARRAAVLDTAAADALWDTLDRADVTPSTEQGLRSLAEPHDE